MATYPTKEEILQAKEPKILKADRLLVEEWKRTLWATAKKVTKNRRDKAKAKAIAELILDLATLKGKPSLKVKLIPNLKNPCYEPATKTIKLSTKPSVITGLHELGHHLFGKSELKACRWSVWMFMKCFPKAYTKLKWEGHMLKKP